MNHDIAAIVVTFRSQKLIDRCLQSLIAEGVPSTNIWLVDNASDDGTVNHVRENYGQVNIIHNHENLGFAAANNQALCHMTAKYVLLLNPDAWLNAEALERMVAVMEQDERIAIVGPSIVRQKQVEQSLLMRPRFWEAWFFLLSGMRAFETGGFSGKAAQGFPWQDVTDGDHVRGACMLVRQEAVTDVGLMDETFFLYFEETEWCLRFRQHGWRVVIAPQATAYHIGKASVRTQERLPSLEFMRSAILFWKKTLAWPAQVSLRVTLFFMVMVKWSLLLPVKSAKGQREWLWRVASLTVNPFGLPIVYNKARRPSSWPKS